MQINKKLSEHILELTKVDQGIRKLRLKNLGSIQELHNYLVYAIDGINSYRLKKIIDEFGYPSQKLIGKKAMKAFWILIQHQDFDLKLQKVCLEKCNFEPKEKALLTDRVLRDKKGDLVPRPIKDKKNLDKLRKSVGLEPYKEHLKKVKKVAKETKNLQLKK